MQILYIHQYFATPEGSTGTRSCEFARPSTSWGRTKEGIVILLFGCSALFGAIDQTVPQSQEVAMGSQVNVLASLSAVSARVDDGGMPLFDADFSAAPTALLSERPGAVGRRRQPLHQSPIVLQIHKHEQQLFEWHPQFNLNVPSFDRSNQPYIRSRTGDMHTTRFVHTLRDGEWAALDIVDDLKAAFPDFVETQVAGGWQQSRIVFDADDYAYTLIRILLADKSRKNLLLYSRNHCRQWQVLELPQGTYALEYSADTNPVPERPAILQWTWRASHPAKWASYNVLRLIIPKKTKNGLELGKPRVLSTDCLGHSQHSGGAAYAVTRDGKTHVVWGEATEATVRGVPTFVATYNRRTGTVGEKVLLAHASPPNDSHNTPGVCVDSEGFIHVIAGAHGFSFLYVRSEVPNDVHGGWTRPRRTLNTGWKDRNGQQRGRQTYVALVCDKEDTLHMVSRSIRNIGDYHKGGYYEPLSYQRKKKNSPWEEDRLLVVPPVPDYSIYYHKLAVDRRGRLYLSYSYYSTSDEYKQFGRKYDFRSMLFSGDGGDTWRLALTRDFVEGMSSPK